MMHINNHWIGTELGGIYPLGLHSLNLRKICYIHCYSIKNRHIGQQKRKNFKTCQVKSIKGRIMLVLLTFKILRKI